jgi:hypothetical protein
MKVNKTYYNILKDAFSLYLHSALVAESIPHLLRNPGPLRKKMDTRLRGYDSLSR